MLCFKDRKSSSTCSVTILDDDLVNLLGCERSRLSFVILVQENPFDCGSGGRLYRGRAPFNDTSRGSSGGTWVESLARGKRSNSDSRSHHLVLGQLFHLAQPRYQYKVLRRLTPPSVGVLIFLFDVIPKSSRVYLSRRQTSNARHGDTTFVSISEILPCSTRSTVYNA